jgi:hypothetical protein
VVVGIEAEETSLQFYSHGIFKGRCGTRPNHGVLLVGYGTEDGLDYWLVQNSWGKAWGEGGFFRMIRGRDGSLGHCGILMHPSYPVVSSRSMPTSPPVPSPVPEPWPIPEPWPVPAPSPVPVPLPVPVPEPPSSVGDFYGRPPCKQNEMTGQIQGSEATALLCAPRCLNFFDPFVQQGGERCPEAPPGVSAWPECVLKDNSLFGRLMGRRYCALRCAYDSSCPDGAICAQISYDSPLSICVYIDEFSATSSEGPQLTLSISSNESNSTPIYP